VFSTAETQFYLLEAQGNCLLSSLLLLSAFISNFSRKIVNIAAIRAIVKVCAGKPLIVV
jgi:hypothetical protein